ncbi:hypothetical protein [Cyclobacterium marinum]|uniref:hypothetical protein n=1 Tax=Cyclobacterium marinum TaxID=104 RepID=UPI0012FBFE57|nr:hypothetical protein [Cyclobacterium marinum]
MRDSGKKILTPSHSKQTPLQNPITFTRDGVSFKDEEDCRIHKCHDRIKTSRLILWEHKLHDIGSGDRQVLLRSKIHLHLNTRVDLEVGRQVPCILQASRSEDFYLYSIG